MLHNPSTILKDEFYSCRGSRARSAVDLAVHSALIPCACVCVRYQTPFSSRHESGPSLFLSTGKHPVGGQLPQVSFSALPGQSSDRPNLPPHPSAITALFLDRSLVVVHLTGHDQIMTVEILRTMAIASPQSGQATARGLPEVFHAHVFQVDRDGSRRSS